VNTTPSRDHAGVESEPSVRGTREKFLLFIAILCVGIVLSIAEAIAAETPIAPPVGLSGTIRLSLDDALALFLRQNLDLIIAKYGIDYAQGQAITARLFPNPVLSVGAVGSMTQGRTLSRTGQVYPQVQQLFEMAGKRGYRIESAAYGIQGAEAAFEDAIRQLSFTLKETYYRVQLGLRRLNLAEENRDRFARILEINTVRFKKGFIAEVDLIRIRLQVVDFHSQFITALQDTESARADLRVLLQLPATTKLELTTDMEYRRIDPDVRAMQQLALDGRPDIRVKRIARAQRSADLKLAQAYRYPDVTIGGGYALQGREGPDNPQQLGLSVGVPLPLFNRNQGGIAQGEVNVQVAEADLRKTLVEVENQVDIAHRNLIQSRNLVEAYQKGVLEDARQTLTIVERAYERGGATILELLDAARTARSIQLNYLESLFNYQRNVFQLESAVGREIST
jgi:cobalt-zinc-cadmium efflux system outer membrane protein